MMMIIIITIIIIIIIITPNHNISNQRGHHYITLIRAVHIQHTNDTK